MAAAASTTAAAAAVLVAGPAAAAAPAPAIARLSAEAPIPPPSESRTNLLHGDAGSGAPWAVAGGSLLLLTGAAMVAAGHRGRAC
ncbi:hypothetical protein LG634_20820 [Streptomyces bambusae]|uniref:hypothetical protein n=1 Tax=Streptomyces bambusae TaxID=1550616 RepID=UPI001CFF1D63|nr:hypothetical protein [Streptomyces bambusae]MCB5167274.1 hypothetical protein [Streptomyces bambusae]